MESDSVRTKNVPLNATDRWTASEYSRGFAGEGASNESEVVINGDFRFLPTLGRRHANNKSPSAGDCETSLIFLFLLLLALLFRTPTGSSPLSLGGFRTRLTAAGRGVFTLSADRDVVDADVRWWRRRGWSDGQPRAGC